MNINNLNKNEGDNFLHSPVRIKGNFGKAVAIADIAGRYSLINNPEIIRAVMVSAIF